MMINTATRNLYDSIRAAILESKLPPVNSELVLRLILGEVSMETSEAINREQAEFKEEEENDG